MLDTLMQRYKSKQQKHALFYEKELFEHRNKPLNILQIGIGTSIAVWHKYLAYSNIYCIDEFNNVQPNKYKYLEEKRVFWSRCDIHDQKSINDVMINTWNNPRFDFIIDDIHLFGYTRYNYLRRYCIGKYYIETNDGVEVKQ